MKTAIIVGSSGQDGELLKKFLLKSNYSVIGIARDSIFSNTDKWNKKLNISSYKEVSNFLKFIKPDEIYFLAAFHHSSEDCIKNELDLINNSYQINFFSYINFLESIKNYSKKTKIFYASSSLIFGDSIIKKQNENTILQPNCIYSMSKYSGLKISEYYRINHSVFCSVGILFNHESHLRKDNFVSKKIVRTAVEIKKRMKEKLVIGDINAKIDWGYAGDFVEAFVMILNLKKSENFVISTGSVNTLKTFVEYVFSYLDLNWKNHVEIDKTILLRKSKKNNCGDFTKLNQKTGWEPKVNLKGLAELMVDEELRLC